MAKNSTRIGAISRMPCAMKSGRSRLPRTVPRPGRTRAEDAKSTPSTTAIGEHGRFDDAAALAAQRRAGRDDGHHDRREEEQEDRPAAAQPAPLLGRQFERDRVGVAPVGVPVGRQPATRLASTFSVTRVMTAARTTEEAIEKK